MLLMAYLHGDRHRIVIRNEQDITIIERISGGCTRDQLISSSSIRSVTSANASPAEYTYMHTLDALQSVKKINVTSLLPPSGAATPALLHAEFSIVCVIQITSRKSRVKSQRMRQLAKSVTRRAVNELEDHRASRNRDMCLIRE